MAENITVSKLWLINALKKLSTAEFYRNLVAVIIGIIITFGGSNLIQKNAERRETAYILSMVKNELQENLSWVEWIKERLFEEYADAVALKPYMNNPESIPADTINMHHNILTMSYGFDARTTAFEVLKNSSQIQHVRNKEMLKELFDLYEDFNNFSSDLTSHNNSKTSSFNHLNDHAEETSDAIFNGNWILAFSYKMDDPWMREHIINIAGGHYNYLKTSVSDKLIAEIAKVTEMIDHEIAR
ncbi:MAG: hypothetical protein LBR57_02560 [Alistipes sp.]|jgi:hypothetical protein|nr:hypothetical protein [Alistipes sp.]